MPVCEKCGAENPAGAVYCSECGYRITDTEQPNVQHEEQGTKMGEAQVHAEPAPRVRARQVRSFSEVWSAIGIAGKIALAGALLAVVGFFIPSTSVTPPGLVVTRSLAGVGGGFLLIPVLALLTMVLVYLSGQPRPLRNRLFIYATIIATGAFLLPAGLFVWLNGLLGGLLIFIGFSAVMAGGYGMMSDSTQSLR